MKTTLLVPLLALACATSLRAQTVAGTQLEIGSAGSDQVTSYTTLGGQVIPATNSGAIGTGNTVYYSNAFAIGIYNKVSATGAVGIGSFNTIGWGFPEGGYTSLAVGTGNNIHGESCFTMGNWNEVAGTDYEWVGAMYSSLVGVGNYTAGISTFAAGENNYITGDSDYGHTSATGVIGRGLISNWSTSLIAGKYNDSTIPQLSGLLFAIGNGVDSAHRSNALEVYADGKIKMPRQGDILMGEFGNGD